MKVYSYPIIPTLETEALHCLEQNITVQQWFKRLAHNRGFTKLNKTSSKVGLIVSPIPIHDHQAATSPLSLRLPRVLTYAHINELMIIAKGKNHT